jgi:hypothetical protein
MHFVHGGSSIGRWAFQHAMRAQDSLINDCNTKVQVNRVVYEENAIRKGHVRANDQVIIFLDDAQYEALYADGRKETKRRQAGEVIWHNRGEDAPTLTNTGKGSYQTLMVNLK